MSLSRYLIPGAVLWLLTRFFYRPRGHGMDYAITFVLWFILMLVWTAVLARREQCGRFWLLYLQGTASLGLAIALFALPGIFVNFWQPLTLLTLLVPLVGTGLGWLGRRRT